MSHVNRLYIPKNEFDWEYYLKQSQDLSQAGINTLETAYKHWLMCGCYENRWVRSLKSGLSVQVKLKTGDKFLVNQAICLPATIRQKIFEPPKPAVLNFKVAILIHIYDVAKMFPFFVTNLNHLSQNYDHHHFDIYINIVEESSPYKGDLKTFVREQVDGIKNPNVSYFFNENRGGDIGGFLLLSKYIVGLGIDYKYVVFVHSKTNDKWRKDLCKPLFNFKFETLRDLPEIGLVGCKHWIHTFDMTALTDDVRRFKYHLDPMCQTYEVNNQCAWQFVAGTMFIAHIDIIKYIANHQVDQVYSKLNRPESLDINWLTIVTDELKRDPRDAGNDLQYRIKYGKPLHPDHMVEHAFERVIGLISHHLGFKVSGQ